MDWKEVVLAEKNRAEKEAKSVSPTSPPIENKAEPKKPVPKPQAPKQD